MHIKKISNKNIAAMLEQIADLLEAKNANPHRIRAYRDGAASVRDAQERVAGLVWEEKMDALRDLPGIGSGLAAVISTYVKTGRSDILERLEGEVSPVSLFERIPGVGSELAGRIQTELGINSLEDLEQAAYDGRLQQVPGFGSERVRAVRMSLAGMLGNARRRAASRVETGHKSNGDSHPDVGTLLSVDAEYREKARAGELYKISPKRFNPEHEAWLPVLNMERNDWAFTALYSNTVQAHQLGTTHDWVVIYYERNNQEGQATVVTKSNQPMEGKRVVRGREVECQRYYEKRKQPER